MSNRCGFLVLGQHALSLCSRLQRPASLFYFDRDGFMSINDRFGHAEGVCSDSQFSVSIVAFNDRQHREIQVLLADADADALMYERKRRKNVA